MFGILIITCFIGVSFVGPAIAVNDALGGGTVVVVGCFIRGDDVIVFLPGTIVSLFSFALNANASKYEVIDILGLYNLDLTDDVFNLD